MVLAPSPKEPNPQVPNMMVLAPGHLLYSCKWMTKWNEWNGADCDLLLTALVSVPVSVSDTGQEVQP